VAFSAELYSELVRLGSEQDLRRLAARYPSVDIEVDDPGVHLAFTAQAGLSQLRAQLTGPSMQTNPGAGGATAHRHN
jgi:molybdenum cofactor cytidylyltransferase